MPSVTSAARLSSLSTSTLSQILELTRSNALGVPSPSLPGQIAKNLKTIKDGISELEKDEATAADSTGTLKELREQFERLIQLSTDLDIEIEGITKKQDDTSAVSDPGDDDVDALALRPMQPHVAIQMSKDTTPYRDQLEEDEETMQRANEEVLQMQRRMMDDQDQTLDSLSSAIARQHQLSLHISSELEAQEGLLDDTDAALDRTDANLRRASGRLQHFTQKAKATGSTGLIVLLVVILVVLITIFR